MSQISINLLPEELTHAKKKTSGATIVIRFSIIALVLMVGISAIVFFITLTQTLRLKSVQESVDGNKNRIIGFKEAEGLAFTLKGQVDGINSIAKVPYPQGNSYHLVTSLLPADVNLFDLTAEQNGTVILSGDTGSIEALNTFFNNLVDESVQNGQIKEVTIDSLSRNIDGRLRFSLHFTIVEAGGTKS